MTMSIGWWLETGLALLKCAMCSSAVSALQPPKTSPHRARKGFSHAPSWWTSERKTKTVCAIYFGSDGPSLPKQLPSLGLRAADVAA
ncbi:hypothetical protein E8M01_33115 [Phreatobacter stygius]|uniref:Uncharacterized protein n=1 Tax=Phreatobacter stygius TaxID=1940610 RepID=A0A4D7BFL7_9HYPH|nr:hypothetical protein E8M01_33115 [Phreatobacter stygius]